MSEVIASVPVDCQFSPKLPGDVGFDLNCRVDTTEQTWLERCVSMAVGKPVQILWPMAGQRLVRTGVRLSMPDGLWCEIRARSSAQRKSLQVLGGTIDSGYTGELYVTLHNFGVRPRLVVHGDRYAQVVFFSAERPHISRLSGVDFASMVEERELALGQQGRGSAGFGSTGR